MQSSGKCWKEDQTQKPCLAINFHTRSTSTPSQIQPLGNIPLLAIQGLLLRLDEVLLHDFHPALPQRQHPCFLTDRLDVRPRKFLLAHDELLQIDVLPQGHL